LIEIASLVLLLFQCFGMLQVHGVRFPCANIWCYCAVAHFRGSINCKNCALLAAVLLFTHVSLHIVQIRSGHIRSTQVICTKPKTPASRKTGW